MAHTYTASTIVYRDTENDERDVIVYFTVPEDWAEKWCKENGYTCLEKFEREYIWDDSYEMYTSAIEDNVIVRVEEDESVSHTW